MANIVDNKSGRIELYQSLGGARGMSDSEVRDLLRSIAKDKTRVLELAKLDMRLVSHEMQQAIGRHLATQLRGQLPPALAQAVAAATVGPEVLQSLAARLANAYGNQTARATVQVATPEAARTQAGSEVLPQQALRWTQFVQKVLQPPGAVLRDRAGVAAPKGELAILAELLGERRESVGAAGLRAPRLVERSLADLSPLQRSALLSGALGEELAGKLLRLGIGDPLSLVQAGALPLDRAALAEALGMRRGKLLALLMRMELLQVGPGKDGEQGIRLELLGPLYRSGIAMLGTLAALRGLSQAELSTIYKKLRASTSGLARAVRNEHTPTKADLMHWARAAARRPSSILLADLDDEEQPLARGDAEELVAAWYLENRLFDELREHERERERREEERREQEDEQRDEQQRDDELSELEYDDQRGDRLMCFWITDFNALPGQPHSMRRMYVCIDPATGGIISQDVEAAIAALP